MSNGHTLKCTLHLTGKKNTVTSTTAVAASEKLICLTVLNNFFLTIVESKRKERS